MNGAAVFGDDARGDGETQAGATILGGKMGQEQAVFIFGRDAVAGVLDADFDGLRFAVSAGGNGDLAEWRGFEGFGGIVDEVDDDAAEKAAVGANRREIVSELGLDGDAVETAGENFDGFVDHSVGAGGRELGGRETHELRELVDQGGERGDFAFDQA